VSEDRPEWQLPECCMRTMSCTDFLNAGRRTVERACEQIKHATGARTVWHGFDFVYEMAGDPPVEKETPISDDLKFIVVCDGGPSVTFNVAKSDVYNPSYDIGKRAVEELGKE